MTELLSGPRSFFSNGLENAFVLISFMRVFPINSAKYNIYITNTANARFLQPALLIKHIW